MKTRSFYVGNIDLLGLPTSDNGLTAAFNPDQERDAGGKWTSGGGDKADTPWMSKVNPSEIEPKANLSGRDLSGMDLTGADLSNADLSNADLLSVNLSGANLQGANLSGANLSGVDLSGTDLTFANLYGADLTNADLTGASLYDADLRNANLSGTNLSDADLTGASLKGANLSGANLERADLSGVDLFGTDLSGVDLTAANLNATDLEKADLTGAHLSNADLTNANLGKADLRGADLTAADLTGTILLGADLHDANLTGTDLTNAIFEVADLFGANLANALELPSSLDPESAKTLKEIEEDAIALRGVASAIKEELGKKDVDVKYDGFETHDYSAEIYNDKGSRIGNMSFSAENGNLNIGMVKIRDEFQGDGIATVIQQAIIAEALDPESKIDFVSFHANVNIGGYAWAETAYPTEESWGAVQWYVGSQIESMKETNEGKNIDFSNVEKALASDDPRAIQIIHDDKTLLPDSLVSKSSKGNELGRELLLGSDWHAVMPTDPETLAKAQSRLAASGATDKSSWMPDVPERDLSEWLPWPCYVREDGSVTDDGIWEDFEEEDSSGVKRTRDFSYQSITLRFNPDQERDENGRWTSGGGGTSESKTGKVDPSEIKPGADLSGRDLSRMELTEVDLSSADLRAANLSDANLSGADLSNAHLTGANLSGANLTGANLGYAYMQGARIPEANLEGANLRGANLDSAFLRATNLSGTDLSGAILKDADLTLANLKGADLRNADLSNAILPESIRTGVNEDLLEKAIAGANFDPQNAEQIVGESIKPPNTTWNGDWLEPFPVTVLGGSLDFNKPLTAQESFDGTHPAELKKEVERQIADSALFGKEFDTPLDSFSEARDYTDSWQVSANSGRSAEMIQESASRVLVGQEATLPDKWQNLYQGQSTQAELVVFQMYQRTQIDLAGAGYKPDDTIKLYRGVKAEYNETFDKFVADKDLSLRPLSSWSADPFVAAQFANDRGTVWAAEVPVANIVATPFTGFGCYKEKEVVVFNNPTS